MKGVCDMAFSPSPTYKVPDLVPISEIRQRQIEILQMIGRGPVTLTQRGRAVAVMVNPEQWNDLIDELEDLRDSLDAIESLAEIEQDPGTVRPLSEARREFVEKGLLDA